MTEKYISETFRTAAAYELFLRLASEKNNLIKLAFKAEKEHFLKSLNSYQQSQNGGINASSEEEA